MSTEQEDAVLLLELEEKITRRIRAQIRAVVDNIENASELHDSMLTPGVMYGTLLQNIRHHLLNDAYFVTEMTKRIGQKMSNTY